MKVRLHYSNRDIALLSLLSGMWALIEINLGLILRAFKLPFSGAILSFFGLVILFLARDVIPQRGTSILLGILTSYLKLIFLGALAFFPIMAILIESSLVEISLSRGKINRTNMTIAAILAMLWSLLHPFFTQGLLSGWGISRVYSTFFVRSAEIFGIPPQNILIVVSIVIMFHCVLGVLASIVGWRLTRQLYFLFSTQQVREHYQNLY
ncbi:MAG: hypothetical protein GXO74_14535 [Calditrichaeota bacterium]|nr:hypothetical protein [Calditrichota bacterium]